MITIIVFSFSLSIASILVFAKILELRYKKSNILLRILGLMDSKVEKLLDNIKFLCLQFIQSAHYVFLVHSKNIAKDALNKIQDKIINEYKNRESTMMGRKNISQNGSVSFYLKKITEDKGNGEKGRIE